ncbi:SOS response-associated peptidase [Flagellimonas myxillae]|uniref:SOS response-associated peptidase n=1 Tax=Flagellimonas myxillae TaxID=2942214 RepID=UPI00201F97EE|nr:SOS response-associated peptidase family protein [Muricauda myxillae]MCL6265071.1 SOS response-associated peptidase [Muricauda myxillae]
MCYATEQINPIADLEKIMDAVARMPDFMCDDDLLRFHINGFAKHYMDGGKKVAEHPMMLIQPQENPKFLTPLMWGFVPREVSGETIPDYYKKTLPYGSGLNATAEKLFSSRMFMESAESRRCVIPVTGFFEPHTTPHKVKGRPFKVPFRFERRDKQVMKLAGIYEFTHDGHATFTIITRKATPLFEKIHNTKKRRPVILRDEQVAEWLDSATQRNELENIIVSDMPDELLYAQPISKDLYAPKVVSNRADISKAVHYKEIEIDYEDKPKVT